MGRLPGRRERTSNYERKCSGARGVSKDGGELLGAGVVVAAAGDCVCELCEYRSPGALVRGRAEQQGNRAVRVNPGPAEPRRWGKLFAHGEANLQVWDVDSAGGRVGRFDGPRVAFDVLRRSPLVQIIER